MILKKKQSHIAPCERAFSLVAFNLAVQTGNFSCPKKKASGVEMFEIRQKTRF